jgi:predicted AlkP superfamily phosphohydrolase/phosphomutase
MMWSTSRRTCASPRSGGCFAPLLAVAIAALAAHAPGQGRVIVIGVDGFDYEVCRDLMTAGDLPALSALAEAGSLIPLYPTNPAQSPVSWATLTTGMNPGKTGVFDFLRREFRNDGSVGADLAFATTGPLRLPWTVAAAAAGLVGIVALVLLGARRRRLAAVTAVFAAMVGLVFGFAPVGEWAGVSVPVNARRGAAVWERADAAGVPGVSLLAPMAFPAPALEHGHLLCGLGVPDVMGTPGTSTSWREEPVPAGRAITPTGCRVRTVRDRGGGVLDGVTVDGPRDKATGARASNPVETRIDRTARTVGLRTEGAPAVVGERQWSPFLETRFSLPWLQEVAALTRFRVIEAGPRAVLYQEPPCFDPRRQNAFVPISAPRSFGGELCADGVFDTLGWGCATNPYQDEIIDEETFLADILETERQREALLWRSLKKPGWRFYFCVLATPDRVQHMFWRDRDEKHPRHEPDAVARRGDPIREAYQRIDRIVDRVRREFVGPDDVLLVVSDHGFAPFRHSVNLNRFLAENGYLVGAGDAIERKIESSVGSGGLFPGMDRSKTRAYSMGLGKIYVNRTGEPGGIVPPSERRALLEEIRERLLTLRHEGLPVVRSAKLREELYSGPLVGDSADLVVGFERGFRVSWQCTLGGMDEPVVAPNRSLWSGDHCSVDPELVPGVLFSSRKLDQSFADVADVAPTIESVLGVASAADCDGRALKFRPR